MLTFYNTRTQLYFISDLDLIEFGYGDNWTSSLDESSSYENSQTTLDLLTEMQKEDGDIIVI